MYKKLYENKWTPNKFLCMTLCWNYTKKDCIFPSLRLVIGVSSAGHVTRGAESSVVRYIAELSVFLLCRLWRNYVWAMWLRDNTKDLDSVITLGFPIVTKVKAGLEFHFQFPLIFLFVVLTNVKWRVNKERKKDTSDQLTKFKPKQIFNLKLCICFL